MKSYPLYLAVFGVVCLGAAVFIPRETAEQGGAIAGGLICLTLAMILQVCRR